MAKAKKPTKIPNVSKTPPKNSPITIKYVKSKSDNQTDYIRSIAENDITFAIGPAGSGKAATLDSLVYTPKGPVKMGDICVGDIVCTPDGGTSTVLKTFYHKQKQIYKIWFDDETFVRVCEDHLWYVYDRAHHSYRIRNTSYIFQNFLQNSGRRRFSIPVTQPCYFLKQDIDIDPYFLGLLLGDGSFRQGCSISTADDFIYQYCKNIAENHGCKLYQHGQMCYNFSTGRTGGKENPITKIIRKCGLMGLKSYDKFIPKNYLYNTIEIRLSVLQGLLDTDGYCGSSGIIEFSTSSKQLSLDIKELVESLGGTCRIVSRLPSYTYKKEKKIGALNYRCYIKLENFKLFRLERKQNKVKIFNKYKTKRVITNVVLDTTEDCKCIFIDHPEHLYLMDNFTVTHNSHIAIGLAVQYLLEGKVDKIVLTRPIVETGEHLGALPGDIQEKVAPYLLPLFDELHNFLPYSTVKEYLNKTDGGIDIVPLAYMRGRNFHNAFIILDEAQNCSYEQLKMFLTRIGRSSKMVITGDPDQSDLPKFKNALSNVVDRLSGLSSVGIIRLTVSDIVRNSIISQILSRLAI